jgi:hypothetical protein
VDGRSGSPGEESGVRAEEGNEGAGGLRVSALVKLEVQALNAPGR